MILFCNKMHGIISSLKGGSCYLCRSTSICGTTPALMSRGGSSESYSSSRYIPLTRSWVWCSLTMTVTTCTLTVSGIAMKVRTTENQNNTSFKTHTRFIVNQFSIHIYYDLLSVMNLAFAFMYELSVLSFQTKIHITYLDKSCDT